MIRVYAEIKDDYGSRSFVRTGRRFVTRQPAFKLMDRHERAYVTDDATGREEPIRWKGMLGAGQKQERVTTTGSTLVRI